MNTRKIRETVQQHLPLLTSIYNKLAGARYANKSTKDIFDELFRHRLYAGMESVSGPGSSLSQTRAIRSELPLLLRKYGIVKLLDAPCGDFHWLRPIVSECDLDYIGVDIVDELIQRNREREALSNARFFTMDICTDSLPLVDCILCRDCLGFFAKEQALQALVNFARSGSKFLLTTTFPGTKCNIEVSTGMWRAINMQLPPFCLPKPLETIREGCTEAGGIFADKVLSLFDLQAWLPRANSQ